MTQLAIIALFVDFFVFFEPEHEHGVPVVTVALEQPIIHVPRDLQWRPVHFDSLVASKFPLQTLYLQNPLAVDAETEPAQVVAVPAVDLDLSQLPTKSRFRGVDFLGDDMLPFQNWDLGSLGFVGSGFGVGFSGQISD
ncbi:hypothetical protein ACE6H2_003960 [Prunus campanulata]